MEPSVSRNAGPPFPPMSRRQRFDVFAEQLLGVAIHEISHLLSDPSTMSRPLPPDRAAKVLAYSVMDSAPVNDGPRATSGVPWFNHGPEFVRVLCHLIHRAQVDLDADARHVGLNFQAEILIGDTLHGGIAISDLKLEPVLEAGLGE